MSYLKCQNCHKWYDTEEYDDDVVNYLLCPLCDASTTPDQMVEIVGTQDDTPEFLPETELQPEYVEFDEGIDEDYIDGELSLNDFETGEDYE